MTLPNHPRLLILAHFQPLVVLLRMIPQDKFYFLHLLLAQLRGCFRFLLQSPKSPEAVRTLQLVYSLNHLAFKPLCIFVFQSLVLAAVNNQSVAGDVLRSYLESLFFVLTVYFWEEKLVDKEQQIRYIVQMVDSEQNSKVDSRFDWIREIFKATRNLCVNLGNLSKLQNHFVGDIKMQMSPKETILLKNVSIYEENKEKGYYSIRNRFGPFDVDIGVSPRLQTELISVVTDPRLSFLVTPFNEPAGASGGQSSTTFSKMVFFGCFYDCTSYLKETPLERVIKRKFMEKQFYMDSMIFAHFIDDQTFKILLEKFIEVSKSLKKKQKETFFKIVAELFSDINTELIWARDHLSDLLLRQIESNGNNTPFRIQLTRLVKTMYMKFRLNFMTLARLNYRVFTHVHDNQQKSRFFWGLMTSFCDLAEVGLLKDVPRFLNVFLENKYLLPKFVQKLLENNAPSTNISFFPVFFKFMMLVSESGLRIFHYGSLLNFCQKICWEMETLTVISNVDEQSTHLFKIFHFLQEPGLIGIVKVLSTLADLEMPVLVPTLILLVSLSTSSRINLDKSNIFFHDLCHFILHPMFFDALVEKCSNVSISTRKIIQVYSKCYEALLSFFGLDIGPRYKLVLIAVAWTIRPMLNSVFSEDQSTEPVDDGYFSAQWKQNLKAVGKNTENKYAEVFRDSAKCLVFLKKQMGRLRRPIPNVFKKYFSRSQFFLSDYLGFQKHLRLTFHMFDKIRRDIEKRVDNSFWTNTRTFNLLTHFNQIFGALSLMSHYRLRHIFFKCVSQQKCKFEAKRVKKDIFLRGRLRVPVHVDLLYLFSLCLQVKSSFCTRSTRLKLVKSKRLNHVVQNFELDPESPQSSDEKLLRHPDRRTSIFVRSRTKNPENRIFYLHDNFKELFKKHKGNKHRIPGELSLLMHLFGLSSKETLLHFSNAALTKEFNKVIDGLLIITDLRLVFVHHIQIKRDGQLYHIQRAQSRECPYMNYLEDKFEPFAETNEQCFKLKYKSVRFHTIKEIHQKPCMLLKNGIEVFLESGKAMSFVVPLGNYQAFFGKLIKALSMYFLGDDSFMNIKSKGYNLEHKEYFFIIIQNVGCGKTLDFKTKRDLTLDLFSKIHQDLVDNFSLLAGFNILAGKSLSQNNNSFVYPLLSPSRGSNCRAKYSAKSPDEVSSSSVDFRKKPNHKSNRSQDNSRMWQLNAIDWQVVETDSQFKSRVKAPLQSMRNVRVLGRHSGFNLEDFGEALRFLNKKVFSKRCEDTDHFEDAYHQFDRMEISESQLKAMQSIWTALLKRVSEGKAVNLAKLRVGETTVTELVPLTCLHLVQSMLRELLRPDTGPADLEHCYFHLDLFSNSHFLMRMHPFTEYHLWTKSSFDSMNRTFNSFSDHFSIVHREASSQEIVPFLYCCPEIFFNSNCLEHKNFSGFKLPPSYQNNFYQSFVDDLYYMLLHQSSKDIARWISLVLDNRDSRESMNVLFAKYFDLFYSAPRPEFLKHPGTKSKMLRKLFLSNQGSIGVHFNKMLKDFSNHHKLFNRNKRNLANLQSRVQKAELIHKHKFFVKSKPFQLSLTRNRRESDLELGSSEQISPKFASESSRSSSSRSSSENDFFYCMREKKHFDSCGPLKKFLSSTQLSRNLTVSSFKSFLIRRDLHLLFEFENTLLVFSEQFRKEFLWVTTSTGNVTAQIFFDFDESIPVLGNSLGQVMFLQLSCKSKRSFETQFFDQCLLHSSFLNFNFEQNFSHFNFYDVRCQKTQQDQVTLRTLAVSHLWTAQFSSSPIISLRRSENTKFIFCGDTLGKVVVLDFFTRSLIRIFDSLSFKYLSVLKTMFVFKSQHPLFPQSAESSYNAYSGVRAKAGSVGADVSGSPGPHSVSAHSQDQGRQRKYLALNKHPILMGPVLSIDINSEDKILVVSFQSFSLFNTNGALLSIFFEETHRDDPFEKGYFVRGNKLDKRLNLLLVTQNSKLRFFRGVENRVDHKASSAQNFNYFLNSSRFFYNNFLEVLFQEIGLNFDTLNMIYSLKHFSVVEVFFSQPNLLFLISRQKQDLKVFEIKLKI